MRGLEQLNAHLGLAPYVAKRDPRCRFLYVCNLKPWEICKTSYDCRFVRSDGGSRARLKTSAPMLMLAFSYFRVMPEFLEFLVLFGLQEQAQDLFYTGFRQQGCHRGAKQGLAIPERAWSGLDLRVCYCLKAVERSSYKEWPFSIRNCAIHYGFDIKYGRATWIIIEAEKSVKQRVESALKDEYTETCPNPNNPAQAFGAAQIIHLIICRWSCENWRWYIRFLEEQLQRLTEGAIITQTSAMEGSNEKADLFLIHPRTEAPETFQYPLRSSFFKNVGSQRVPGSNNTEPDSNQIDSVSERRHAVKDLQEIQDIQERAVEALTVLRLNCNVMLQLSQYTKAFTNTHELFTTLS